MPPNHLYLIRHAQGYHNLNVESHKIRDPDLTPKGEQQCIHLAANLDNIDNIDCIVASPLKRTLMTALNVFQSVLKARPELRVIALPELQETSTMPCDTGTELRTLKREMAAYPIDWTYVQNDWIQKHSGRYAPRADLVAKRALWVRRFCQRREEKEVAVVTHGGFLHFLTEDWAGSDKHCGTGWANTEMRQYKFDESSPDAMANATLIETRSSMNRRIDDLRPLSIDEQLELAATAQQSWAKDGYITLPDPQSTEDATCHAQNDGPTPSASSQSCAAVSENEDQCLGLRRGSRGIRALL